MEPTQPTKNFATFPILLGIVVSVLIIVIFFLTQGTNILGADSIRKCDLKTKGDTNCDGLVDTKDLTEWRNEFTLKTNARSADFNQDGKVNGDDYRILMSKFSASKYIDEKARIAEKSAGTCGWCGQDCTNKTTFKCANTAADKLEFHNYTCETQSSGSRTICVKRLLDLDGLVLN